jgi:hypothetical protein
VIPVGALGAFGRLMPSLRAISACVQLLALPRLASDGGRVNRCVNDDQAAAFSLPRFMRSPLTYMTPSATSDKEFGRVERRPGSSRSRRSCSRPHPSRFARPSTAPSSGQGLRSIRAGLIPQLNRMGAGFGLRGGRGRNGPRAVRG